MFMNTNPTTLVSGELILKGVSKTMLRAFGVTKKTVEENHRNQATFALDWQTHSSMMFHEGINLRL